jgi:alpha-1,6-mannosyltransferase
MGSKAVHIFLRFFGVAVLCILYYWIGYRLDRTSFWLLFSLYTIAFAASYYLMQSSVKLKYLIGLSFGLKLIFLFAVPELSQDFYRFIWDGMLTIKGYNPYLHLPVELMTTSEFSSESFNVLLYDKMGELSANNYSTYPPVAQLFYSLSYAIGGNNLLLNIIILRLINLIAELGILYVGLKILEHLKLPKVRILYFILNPLVILESTFSLHFEVVMLLFLALSLYYLYKSQLYLSAIGLAGAVAAKLMPLMFLPLLFSFLNKKMKAFNTTQIFGFLGFCTVSLVSLIIAYSWLWDPELLSKNFETLSLYFSSFEFNASIYYVLRWIGYQWTGYNMIGLLGKAGSIVSLGFIVYLSLRFKKISFRTLLQHMLWASTLYYLLSTTVHPWYLMLPLFLCVFTKFNYMLVWSWLVFLSYAAYANANFEENLWLIALEYGILASLLFFEVLLKKRLFLCRSSFRVDKVDS